MGLWRDNSKNKRIKEKEKNITDLWKGNRPFCVSMMGPSPTFMSNKTTLIWCLFHISYGLGTLFFFFLFILETFCLLFLPNKFISFSLFSPPLLLPFNVYFWILQGDHTTPFRLCNLCEIGTCNSNIIIIISIGSLRARFIFIFWL